MANNQTYRESGGFACDAAEIYEMFRNFSIKEMDKVAKAAVGKGASIIAKQTKTNLKSRLPASRVRNVTKYKDTLVDAVKTSVFKKKGTTPNEGKVHIMGTRDKYSGTFRTRFFELGTDDRYRKDPRTGKKVFCGRINAEKLGTKYFFKSAIQTTKNEVLSAMDEMLEKKIIEINDKKF